MGLVFTDTETDDKKLPFDYVATAVGFIISNMRQSEAMAAAFQQHTPDWFRGHPLEGKRISHAECNAQQDLLLAYLRSTLQVTRTEVVATLRSSR